MAGSNKLEYYSFSFVDETSTEIKEQVVSLLQNETEVANEFEEDSQDEIEGIQINLSFVVLSDIQEIVIVRLTFPQLQNRWVKLRKSREGRPPITEDEDGGKWKGTDGKNIHGGSDCGDGVGKDSRQDSRNKHWRERFTMGGKYRCRETLIPNQAVQRVKEQFLFSPTSGAKWTSSSVGRLIAKVW